MRTLKFIPCSMWLCKFWKMSQIVQLLLQTRYSAVPFTTFKFPYDTISHSSTLSTWNLKVCFLFPQFCVFQNIYLPKSNESASFIYQHEFEIYLYIHASRVIFFLLLSNIPLHEGTKVWFTPLSVAEYF